MLELQTVGGCRYGQGRAHIRCQVGGPRVEASKVLGDPKKESKFETSENLGNGLEKPRKTSETDAKCAKNAQKCGFWVSLGKPRKTSETGSENLGNRPRRDLGEVGKKGLRMAQT